MILIDAVSRGESPGTLYVIEPELPDADEQAATSGATIDGHTLDPMQVLRLAREMGGQLKRVLLVGCEPERLGGEEPNSTADFGDDLEDQESGRLGLSAPVTAALNEAEKLVAELVADLSRPVANVGPNSHA